MGVDLIDYKSQEETEAELRERLRREMLRAVVPAVAKLARAARGEGAFSNEPELRACVALARLAPALVAPSTTNPAPGWQPTFVPTEEQERLLIELEQSREAHNVNR